MRGQQLIELGTLWMTEKWIRLEVPWQEGGLFEIDFFSFQEWVEACREEFRTKGELSGKRIAYLARKLLRPTRDRELPTESDLGVGVVDLRIPFQLLGIVPLAEGEPQGALAGLCDRISEVAKLLGFLKANARIQLRLSVPWLRVKRNLDEGRTRGLDGLYEKEIRSVSLGTLDFRNGKCFLHGVEIPMSIVGKVFKEWVGACLVEVLNSEFSVARARDLARAVATFHIHSHLRSQELFRRVVGENAVERFLRERRLRFKSVDGNEYEIEESGDVFRIDAGKRTPVCVHVAGENRLPVYDRVVALYLALRDHPEVLSPHLIVVEGHRREEDPWVAEGVVTRCSKCGRFLEVGGEHMAVVLQIESGVRALCQTQVTVERARTLAYMCVNCIDHNGVRIIIEAIRRTILGECEVIEEEDGLPRCLNCGSEIEPGEESAVFFITRERFVEAGQRRDVEVLDEHEVARLCMRCWEALGAENLLDRIEMLIHMSR
jgi:hypothetical protein